MIVHKIAFAVCDIKIKSIYLRQPGIEPRSTAWEAAMITITPLSLLQSRKETMMTKGHARNVWRGSQNTTRDFCSLFFVEHSLTQPRSQSSSAISDVTSPVKLVGKIRLGRLANNGKSKMAASRQECDYS